MLTRQRSQGFTLIELMISLVIIALLVVLAFPSYRAWMESTRVRNVAESIQNGLQFARAEAVRRNATVQFVMAADASGWEVTCFAQGPSCPAADTDPTATPIQSWTRGQGGAASVSLTSTQGTTVRFNNFGRMVFPTLAAPATYISFSLESSAISDARELRLDVDAGGGVRMCDPSVTDTADPRKCRP